MFFTYLAAAQSVQFSLPSSGGEAFVTALAQKTNQPIVFAESFNFEYKQIKAPAISIDCTEKDFSKTLKAKLGETPSSSPFGLNQGLVDVTSFFDNTYSFGPPRLDAKHLSPSENRAPIQQFDNRHFCVDGKVNSNGTVRMPLALIITVKFSKPLQFCLNYNSAIVDINARSCDERDFLNCLAAALNCKLVETPTAFKFDPVPDRIRAGFKNWVNHSTNKACRYGLELQSDVLAMYDGTDKQISNIWYPAPKGPYMDPDSTVEIDDSQLLSNLTQLSSKVGGGYAQQCDFTKPLLWFYYQQFPVMAFLGKDPKYIIRVL